MILTPNFTLEELVASEVAARRGLDNTPGASSRANLLRLASTVLEPIRKVCGDREVKSLSGYRAPAVNLAVGGAASSAHVDGRADDLIIPSLPILVVYETIARADLPIDQLIFEYGRWIHAAIARNGETPRRQLLMKLVGRGYETFDPNRAALAVA